MTTATPDIERILTLHPDGKNGVNIAREKYDDVYEALLRLIPRDEAWLPLNQLAGKATPLLRPDLFPEGKAVTWYIMAVKQDMEARGILEKVPGVSPQHLRRTD